MQGCMLAFFCVLMNRMYRTQGVGGESLESLKNKLYRAMDVPKETFLNIPLVTIVGNDELVIENYKAVLDYKEDFIKINTKIGIVKITGKKMTIKYIRKDEISVTGVIRNIEYV